jgi:hypothetical protein
MVYEVWYTSSLYLSETEDRSLVATMVGSSLGLTGRVAFPLGGRAINGDQVQALDAERVRQASTGRGGIIVRADAVAVVCRALERHGVKIEPGMARSAPASAAQPTPGPQPATPARCAHVQSLVAAGRLSKEDAAAVGLDGRVSDTDWQSVRDL